MNGIERFIMGGWQPTLITLTGSEQALPAKCIGIYPNSGGCILTSLKQTDGTNLATSMGIVSVDLADKQIPLFIKGAGSGMIPQYLTYITGTASGTCWAITE